MSNRSLAGEVTGTIREAPASGDTAGHAHAAADHSTRPFDVYSRECPSRVTLEHITGRWGALTLVALRDGPVRFNELRRRVDGVSQKILAQTLHDLERDGLVHRNLISTFPLRVEYTLTASGHGIADRLLALVEELSRHMPAIMQAQRTYDDRATNPDASEPSLGGQDRTST